MTRERTRFVRALELLERLERGPAFGFDTGRAFTREEALEKYRIWSSSWILDEVKALVPELRDEARVARARRGPDPTTTTNPRA
jgi:hypothetical protein